MSEDGECEALPENPEICLTENIPNGLSMWHVQELILWILGDIANPSWVFVKHRLLIPKIVVVMVDNLRRGNFDPEKDLPLEFKRKSQAWDLNVFYSNFSDKVVSQSFYSCSDRLMFASVTDKNLKKRKRNNLEQEDALKSQQESDEVNKILKKAAKEGFLLSEEELKENFFPLASPSQLNQYSEELFEFKETNSSSCDSFQEMVALDCEMVTTKLGLELARMTLLDKFGCTIVDMLVKPDNVILDYNTKYSGITAEILSNVCSSLADAQNVFLKYVSS